MDVDASLSSSLPPPTKAQAPLHVVICPWLAFGHLLPYLELADRLASRGHRVSFVSTPRNLARLPEAHPLVDLVALPFPRVDGLPDGAESTNDVPGDKRELHWKAFDGLAVPFAEFMAAACASEDRKPHWVIGDCYHHWAAAAAVEHKVPFGQLHPTSAMMVAAASGSMPRYEQDGARFFTSQGASGMSRAQRCSLTHERSTIAVIRSCLEWEPEPLQQLMALSDKPVVPLGLLPPSPGGARRAASTGDNEHAAVRWLDAQPPKSVVYVALGSEVPLRVEQVHELALGLDLAGMSFLWALRKPPGSDTLDAAADILPPGFQERTHAYGLVTMGWVPQMSILAHGAIGGFLTHCGRNSLIEGLLFGHPLIMLPIIGDQGPNARVMEGKKVGLQVARDENDGSFDRQGIAAAVRAVMLEGEERRAFVSNALKLQQMVADKELQDRYIDEFVHQLRSYINAP